MVLGTNFSSIRLYFMALQYNKYGAEIQLSLFSQFVWCDNRHLYLNIPDENHIFQSMKSFQMLVTDTKYTNILKCYISGI